MKSIHNKKTKYYYTMGEVCRITNLKPYVIRFWESQFSQLNARRRHKKKSNRLYTNTHIELIKKIAYLLYERKFTIKGAQKHLKDEALSKEIKTQHTLSAAQWETLHHIREELLTIKKLHVQNMHQ